ncbi:glutathione transferase [Laetiporus sulphureus 93-53]|uniref:glutathione transferase n=1 Tax=Laetiporus sulphureus 93-53 TaxID=1314785 RepID=A0A165DHD2_9APHY|nr:glutathione transferase [Laetiporus sulphureus 93-53]KZT04880.1 glutathione transferase [Laetiporus sulphureus 93-53]
MVLKLHGSPMSTCTRRVAVVLKEKNVPYELVKVDLMKDEQKSAAFMANQPFGQVPYIVEEDGFQLFESRAIGRYIALKYAGQGNDVIPSPADLKRTALFEQAASIELTNFDPFASGLAFEKVFKPNKKLGQTEERVVSALLQQLNVKMDAYEAMLSKSKYLAGDDVTLADLFHLTYGSMLCSIGIDVLESPKRPNVVRWWKDLTSRPSWQAVKDGA